MAAPRLNLLVGVVDCAGNKLTVYTRQAIHEALNRIAGRHRIGVQYPPRVSMRCLPHANVYAASVPGVSTCLKDQH